MTGRTGPNPILFAPGLLLFSLGLLVWFLPDFLRFVVASVLCGLGGLLVMGAFRPRGPGGGLGGGIRIQGLGGPGGFGGPFSGR